MTIAQLALSAYIERALQRVSTFSFHYSLALLVFSILFRLVFQVARLGKPLDRKELIQSRVFLHSRFIFFNFSLFVIRFVSNRTRTGLLSK